MGYSLKHQLGKKRKAGCRLLNARNPVCIRNEKVKVVCRQEFSARKKKVVIKCFG